MVFANKPLKRSKKAPRLNFQNANAKESEPWKS
jgi:hypothetical protein